MVAFSGKRQVFGGKRVVDAESSPAFYATVGAGGEPAWGGGEVAVFQRNSTAAARADVALLSGHEGDGQLLFSDSADYQPGKVRYNHLSNFMAFTTNGNEAFRINSSGGLQATLLPTADPGVTGQLWTDTSAAFVIKISS